jgi:putative endonuclease
LKSKTCHPERRARACARNRGPRRAVFARWGGSPAVRDGFHYTFWVYILTSRTGTFYIGITGYIDRRISQHKMDSIEGFTKKYKVHRLVYYETFDYVLNAIRREKQLKGWRREKKIAVIEKTKPRCQDLSES